jgi:hypothetical protein
MIYQLLKSETNKFTIKLSSDLGLGWGTSLSPRRLQLISIKRAPVRLFFFLYGVLTKENFLLSTVYKDERLTTWDSNQSLSSLLVQVSIPEQR